MSFYDSLLMKYGTNEPIFFNDIEFENYSQIWIKKQLKKLCDEGELIRFEKGVYYIPTNTVFGKSILNPRKVIEKKFINDGKDVIGYYSGLVLLNKLRLSTQMPNVLEVCTNNETTNVRSVMVGNQKVLLRKSRTEITKNNVAVLAFLEMMNDINPATLGDDEKGYITEYIRDNGITQGDIVLYAPVFPDKVMRNLIESEVIFNIEKWCETAIKTLQKIVNYNLLKKIFINNQLPSTVKMVDGSWIVRANPGNYFNVRISFFSKPFGVLSVEFENLLIVLL